MRNLMNPIRALSFVSIAAFMHTATAALPPVLEYLPGCDYQQTDVITLNRRHTLNTHSPHETQFDNLRRELIETAQKQAPSGILGLHIVQFEYHQEELRGQTRSDSDRFHARLKLQVVGIFPCSPDQEHLRQPTRYTATGDRRLGRLRARLQPSSPMEIRIEQPKSMQLLHHNIDPNYGFYGASIGMNEAELVAIFSAPDTTMLLTHQARLLGFGRDHWVWLKDGKVSAFSHNNPLLSPYGRIQISDTHPIEFTQWELLLNSEPISVGTTAEHIAPSSISSEHALELIFNPHRDPAPLSGVTIRRQDFSFSEFELPFSESKRLNAALHHLGDVVLSPSSQLALETLQQTLLDLPISNQTDLPAGRRLTWLAPDLAVTWGANDIRQIEVAPFFQALNDTARSDYWLQHMGLPATVEEWEQALPSAFAMAGELTAFEESFSITLYYDERADDQPIQSFKIEFH